MRKKKVHITLFFIIIFAIIGNVIWILLDQSPPLWDIAGHSQRSLQIAEQLRHFDFFGVLFSKTIYPPFSYIVTAVFFFIFGYHEDIPQFSLLPWLVLLVASTFFITKRLYGRNDLALFAAALAIFYPLLVHFSRIYDLDFQLTAIVTAAVAALVKADYFTNLRWGVIFAILFALALLIKWTAIIFLTPLAIFIIIRSWKNNHHITYLNLVLVIILVTILVVPWYLAHFYEIIQTIYASSHNIFSVPYSNLFTVGNFSYYIKKVIQGITWPLAFLLFGGLFYVIRQRKFPDLFLLVWIFVPYIIFTFFFYSKESRYLLPIYPALAITSSLTILYLKGKWRYFLIAPVLTFGFIIWTETSWNLKFSFNQIFLLEQFSAYGLQTVTTEKVWYGFTYPTSYQTVIKEIPLVVQEDVSTHFPKKEQIRIAIVPNSIFFTAQQIQYYGRLSGLERKENAFTVDYSLSSLVRGPQWRNYVTQADYLVTKTGEQGPTPWVGYLNEVTQEEQKQGGEIFDHFELVQRWPLNGIESSQQEARLYRRKD